MTEHTGLVYRFADVEVHEREFNLTKAGEVLAVEPKSFRVLLYLVRNPQKVITKDELLDAVWSDITVSENSVARAVAQLRRLLGDNIHEPRYIATVATVGYRFVCPVEVVGDGAANPEEASAVLPLPNIGDMHLLLETASVPVRTHRPWLAWGAVAVFLVAFAALSLIHFRERPLVPTPVQFQISPSGRMLQADAFAVSPDGRHLAFVATGSDGIPRLWIRNLDSLEVRVLSDSYPASWRFRGVVGPFFWSPDSRFIGFQSGGKLAKIEISGGPAQALCDVQGTVLGGSWNRDGVIVFADNIRGLMQVSAAGGVASPLTTVDSSRKEVNHV